MWLRQPWQSIFLYLLYRLEKIKIEEKIREIFLALENLSLYDYAGLKPTIFDHITHKENPRYEAIISGFGQWMDNGGMPEE